MLYLQSTLPGRGLYGYQMSVGRLKPSEYMAVVKNSVYLFEESQNPKDRHDGLSNQGASYVLVFLCVQFCVYSVCVCVCVCQRLMHLVRLTMQ